jgi:hypothetical protein
MKAYFRWPLMLIASLAIIANCIHAQRLGTGSSRLEDSVLASELNQIVANKE